MLRSILIAVGALFALGGAALLIAGNLGGIPPLAMGALLLLGTVWERVRYKPIESTSPGSGWVPTDERFVDEAGRTVQVWVEPKSGERRYVAL
ncbi:MAG: hypothetical protein JO261_00050 [Alphaproteobacteria bacterium]|nr:hypothetical protein [Alphaproteobacteria bacterium]MBV9692064.1 hypothetical protein [Alphaproteobacteria bacterium]